MYTSKSTELEISIKRQALMQKNLMTIRLIMGHGSQSGGKVVAKLWQQVRSPTNFKFSIQYCF